MGVIVGNQASFSSNGETTFLLVFLQMAALTPVAASSHSDHMFYHAVTDNMPSTERTNSVLYGVCRWFERGLAAPLHLAFP